MKIKTKDMALPVTSVSNFGSISHMRYSAGDQFDLDAEASYIQAVQHSFDASGCDVLSLDVFDTVLLRNEKSELRRFAETAASSVEILEKHGAKPGSLSAEDVLILRNFATLASYRASESVRGYREGCLDDICATMSRSVLGHANAVDDLVLNELKYEAGQLTVSKAVRSLVQTHASKGGKVICISDMYMKSARIRNLFDMIDPELSDLISVIYSSADVTLSKSSGLIFDLVAEEMDIVPSRFYHIGDALVGDYQRPRENGWKSLYLPVPRKMQEVRFQDHVDTADGLIQMHGIKVSISKPVVH